MKRLMLAVLPLMLSACGDSGPDLRAHLTGELPEFWELTDFDLVAEENTGTEVSPNIEFRFAAKARPDEAIYQEVVRIEARSILEEVYPEKDHALHGTGTSRIHAGEWRTEFDYEEAPWRSYGRPGELGPLEGFENRNALLVGTDEFQEFRKGILAKAEEAQTNLEAAWAEANAFQQAAREKQIALQQEASASSKGIQELKARNRKADNELFRQVGRTAGTQEAQADVVRRLEELRAEHRALENAAVEQHNTRVASHKAEIQQLNEDVQEKFAAANKLHRGTNATQAVAQQIADLE